MAGVVRRFIISCGDIAAEFDVAPPIPMPVAACAVTIPLAAPQETAIIRTVTTAIIATLLFLVVPAPILRNIDCRLSSFTVVPPFAV